MRSQTNRFLVPSLLILAIIIVTANAWLAFRSLRSIETSQSWVQHTWQVIDQVERVVSSADDAESSARRYILSGEPSYLDLYQHAAQQLGPEIDTFQSLTSDNPRQQNRSRAMRSLLDQRMDLLAHNIEMRQKGSRGVDLNLDLLVSGKAEQDQLRNLAHEMETEERGLLNIRTTTVRSDFWRARAALALATALDLLLIVLMFGYLLRERGLRLAAESAAADLALAQHETELRAQEIRELNADLENRVKQRTAELEVTNRELEAFSYSVSHDLRAPLRTIDGFSLALEEDYLNEIDDVGKDYIRRVRTGVQRMGQLIDSLLQLSRITRAELAREDFNLSEMAESVASNLADEKSGRATTFQIEKDLQANGDPRLVRVALENLLGNAVKFSSKTENPAVSFAWDPDQHAWRVRDNGAGFDMYYADKLFNAFNRLHGDKDFKGSGIGLATVARVVRRHHGRIWADSIEGQGATFWFTLGNETNDRFYEVDSAG
jgi:signal transduction histidine kinase